MRILLTNDDGIFAKGIQSLVKELEKYYEVIIVAPDSQKSASSHSITLTKALVVKEQTLDGIKSKAFSVSGTPADCVKLALTKLINDKVDLVISGTNDGYNLGTDVIYSGTVSAAVESAIFKIPSIALSCDGKDCSYDLANKVAVKVIKKIEQCKLKNDFVLNINIPHVDDLLKNNIKVCRIGERTYKNFYIETLNEDGSTSLEIHGNEEDKDEEETDLYNIKRGYITLTPLHYDLTNFKIIKEVKNIFDKI